MRLLRKGVDYLSECTDESVIKKLAFLTFSKTYKRGSVISAMEQ